MVKKQESSIFYFFEYTWNINPPQADMFRDFSAIVCVPQTIFILFVGHNTNKGSNLQSLI